MSRRDQAIERLQKLLNGKRYPLRSRLPAERLLCVELGLSRSALREGLEALEAEGRIWRHVGKGTFVGNKPALGNDGLPPITSQISPVEVMETRLAIEPVLARLAALHATDGDIENMRYLLDKSEAARDAKTWELWDGTLHRAIAESTHNNLLLSIFDAFNAIRRQESWSRLRQISQTPERLHLYREHHRDLVRAIAERDPEFAETMMRRHIESVRNNLFNKSAAGTKV
ncbi:MAG: FadR/GntR family transcriptional regulator [Dongiaceae bacterium]